jgi:hypothetical protein
MLTYLWDLAVAISIEDISNDEDTNGSRRERCSMAGGRWEGSYTHANVRCFKESGDEFCRMKPSRPSNPLRGS